MKLPEVINRFGNPQPFLPEGTALGEQAQLSMAPGEPGIGGHCRQDDLTKAFMPTRPSRDATVCVQQSMARR